MSTRTLLRTIQEAVAIEDKVLTDIGLRNHSVMYLRTETITGADADTGTKGTVTVKDTRLPSNPKVEDAGFKAIQQSNGYVKAGDLYITIPGHWYTEPQLWAAKGFVYDGSLWKVIQVHGEPEESTPIKFKVLIRKMMDTTGVQAT